MVFDRLLDKILNCFLAKSLVGVRLDLHVLAAVTETMLDEHSEVHEDDVGVVAGCGVVGLEQTLCSELGKRLVDNVSFWLRLVDLAGNSELELRDSTHLFDFELVVSRVEGHEGTLGFFSFL